MKRIIGDKTKFYSSIMTKSIGSSFENVLDRSADLRKEISMILPKGGDYWIGEDSQKESFFFKKRKKTVPIHQPTSPDHPIQKEIKAVNQKRNLLKARASSTLPQIRKNDPKGATQRAKSLPRVVISGGYSLSQQKLLEIRELFFSYSAGAETITLDCRLF